jgi:hypothetical protein
MALGFIGKLLGGGVGEMAKGVASAIDTFVETAEEKKAAEIILMKAQQEPDKWQAVTNQIEAKHRTIFVAGWRPFIGWVSGIGIGWHFVGYPFAQFICEVLGKTVTLPVLQTGELMTLILGMLGLGATRTYEKKHNLTR